VRCLVIFLQGFEDKVVPPNQAQTMFNAAREKSLPWPSISRLRENSTTFAAPRTSNVRSKQLAEPVRIENV
jgi:hypothetical protein